MTADVAAVPAAFAPGAKIFIEPMEGFGDLVTDSIAKKKVPVVVVKDRAQADFVMTGVAHLKTYKWLASNLLWPHGGAHVLINDAHTGGQVFAFNSTRVDSNEQDGWVYQIWADNVAGHLKKQMKKAAETKATDAK